MSEVVETSHNTQEGSRFRRIASLVGSSAEIVSASLGRREGLDPPEHRYLSGMVGRVALVGGAYHFDDDMYEAIKQAAQDLAHTPGVQQAERVGVGTMWPYRNPNDLMNQRMEAAAHFLGRTLRDEHAMTVDVIHRPAYVIGGDGSERLRAFQSLSTQVMNYEARVMPEDDAAPLPEVAYVGVVNQRRAARVFDATPFQAPHTHAVVMEQTDDTPFFAWQRAGIRSPHIPMYD